MKQLTDTFGSPIFVLEEKVLRGRAKSIIKAFSHLNLDVHYAMKCNPTREIIQTLCEEGIHIDASNAQEIQWALDCGISADRIILTNMSKTDDDIALALSQGIKAMTADSLDEIDRILSVCDEAHQAKLFLRINPHIRLKNYLTQVHPFGISIEDEGLMGAVEKILDHPHAAIVGLHFHGTQITDTGVYAEALEKLAALAKSINDMGGNIEFLDHGGGFPIDMDIDEFSKEFTAHCQNILKEKNLQKVRLIFEPGKWLVNSAMYALCKVTEVKDHHSPEIVLTNASCYTMLPDVLVCKKKYEMVKINEGNTEKQENEKNKHTYTLYGATCDARDCFGDYAFTTLERGDILKILDCGAYSISIASNFNFLPKPNIVFVKENGESELLTNDDGLHHMTSRHV